MIDNFAPKWYMTQSYNLSLFSTGLSVCPNTPVKFTLYESFRTTFKSIIQRFSITKSNMACGLFFRSLSKWNIRILQTGGILPILLGVQNPESGHSTRHLRGPLLPHQPDLLPRGQVCGWPQLWQFGGVHHLIQGSHLKRYLSPPSPGLFPLSKKLVIYIHRVNLKFTIFLKTKIHKRRKIRRQPQRVNSLSCRCGLSRGKVRPRM